MNTSTKTLIEAEIKEMQAAQDEYEAEIWDDEMQQLRWAECGGYAAGLSRPASRFDRAYSQVNPSQDSLDTEDIAF